jgi:membrane protein
MRPAGRAVARFWRAAYEDNLTGLAAMVAYNLILSLLPLMLVALFVAGRLLGSGEIESSVVADLQRLFPGAAESTLLRLVDEVHRQSTSLGIGALAASIWVGASFWGALDTAFCRIYRLPCRTWIQQKRFALGMLVVSLAFMAASVAVPTFQSLLTAGTKRLPFGLEKVRGGLFVGGGLVALFLILCLIYFAVPKGRAAWKTVWPGAFGATLAMGAVDYAFPLYLSNVSTLGRFGTTFVFVLIVLVWFYLLAIIMLGGAVINALRGKRA